MALTQAWFCGSNRRRTFAVLLLLLLCVVTTTVAQTSPPFTVPATLNPSTQQGIAEVQLSCPPDPAQLIGDNATILVLQDCNTLSNITAATEIVFQDFIGVIFRNCHFPTSNSMKLRLLISAPSVFGSVTTAAPTTNYALVQFVDSTISVPCTIDIRTPPLHAFATITAQFFRTTFARGFSLLGDTTVSHSLVQFKDSVFAGAYQLYFGVDWIDESALIFDSVSALLCSIYPAHPSAKSAFFIRNNSHFLLLNTTLTNFDGYATRQLRFSNRSTLTVADGTLIRNALRFQGDPKAYDLAFPLELPRLAIHLDSLNVSVYLLGLDSGGFTADSSIAAVSSKAFLTVTALTLARWDAGTLFENGFAQAGFIGVTALTLDTVAHSGREFLVKDGGAFGALASAWSLTLNLIWDFGLRSASASFNDEKGGNLRIDGVTIPSASSIWTLGNSAAHANIIPSSSRFTFVVANSIFKGKLIRDGALSNVNEHWWNVSVAGHFVLAHQRLRSDLKLEQFVGQGGVTVANYGPLQWPGGGYYYPWKESSVLFKNTYIQNGFERRMAGSYACGLGGTCYYVIDLVFMQGTVLTFSNYTTTKYVNLYLHHSSALVVESPSRIGEVLLVDAWPDAAAVTENTTVAFRNPSRPSDDNDFSKALVYDDPLLSLGGLRVAGLGVILSTRVPKPTTRFELLDLVFNRSNIWIEDVQLQTSLLLRVKAFLHPSSVLSSVVTAYPSPSAALVFLSRIFVKGECEVTVPIVEAAPSLVYLERFNTTGTLVLSASSINYPYNGTKFFNLTDFTAKDLFVEGPFTNTKMTLRRLAIKSSWTLNGRWVDSVLCVLSTLMPIPLLTVTTSSFQKRIDDKLAYLESTRTSLTFQDAQIVTWLMRTPQTAYAKDFLGNYQPYTYYLERRLSQCDVSFQNVSSTGRLELFLWYYSKLILVPPPPLGAIAEGVETPPIDFTVNTFEIFSDQGSKILIGSNLRLVVKGGLKFLNVDVGSLFHRKNAPVFQNASLSLEGCTWEAGLPLIFTDQIFQDVRILWSTSESQLPLVASATPPQQPAIAILVQRCTLFGSLLLSIQKVGHNKTTIPLPTPTGGTFLAPRYTVRMVNVTTTGDFDVQGWWYCTGLLVNRVSVKGNFIWSAGTASNSYVLFKDSSAEEHFTVGSNPAQIYLSGRQFRALASNSTIQFENVRIRRSVVTSVTFVSYVQNAFGNWDPVTNSITRAFEACNVIMDRVYFGGVVNLVSLNDVVAKTSNLYFVPAVGVAALDAKGLTMEGFRLFQQTSSASSSRTIPVLSVQDLQLQSCDAGSLFAAEMRSMWAVTKSLILRSSTWQGFATLSDLSLTGNLEVTTATGKVTTDVPILIERCVANKILLQWSNVAAAKGASNFMSYATIRHTRALTSFEIGYQAREWVLLVENVTTPSTLFNPDLTNSRVCFKSSDLGTMSHTANGAQKFAGTTSYTLTTVSSSVLFQEGAKFKFPEDTAHVLINNGMVNLQRRFVQDSSFIVDSSTITADSQLCVYNGQVITRAPQCDGSKRLVLVASSTNVTVSSECVDASHVSAGPTAAVNPSSVESIIARASCNGAPSTPAFTAPDGSGKSNFDKGVYEQGSAPGVPSSLTTAVVTPSLPSNDPATSYTDGCTAPTLDANVPPEVIAISPSKTMQIPMRFFKTKTVSDALSVATNTSLLASTAPTTALPTSPAPMLAETTNAPIRELTRTIPPPPRTTSVIRRDAITVTKTLPPPTKAPPPPTAPPVAESTKAIQTTAASTTVAAAMVNPAVAAQTNRAAVALSLSSCILDLDTPLGFTNSPTGMSLTSDITAQYVGAAIFNLPIIAGGVVLHFLLVVFSTKGNPKINQQRTAADNDTDAEHTQKSFMVRSHKAMANLRFPAASAMIMIMVLAQPTVSSAVTAIRHGTDPLGVALGSISLLVIISALLGSGFYVRSIFTSQFDDSINEIVVTSWFWDFLNGRGKWSDPTTTLEGGRNPDDVQGFTRRYGLFFNLYYPRAVWCGFAEAVICVIFGIMDGLQSNVPWQCAALLYALTTVNALYLLMMVFLRPFIAAYDTLAFVVISSLQTLSAISATLVFHEIGGDTLEWIGENAALASMLAASIKGLGDLVLEVYKWNDRRKNRIAQKEKEALMAKHNKQQQKDAADLVAKNKGGGNESPGGTPRHRSDDDAAGTGNSNRARSGSSERNSGSGSKKTGSEGPSMLVEMSPIIAASGPQSPRNPLGEQQQPLLRQPQLSRR